jgi:hypothetical protein
MGELLRTCTGAGELASGSLAPPGAPSVCGLRPTPTGRKEIELIVH